MGSQAISILWAGISLLGLLAGGILLSATFARTFRKWSREYRERKKREYRAVLIGYLSGTITLDNITGFIENHTDSIEPVFEVCKELQENLRGAERKKIQKLLSQNVFTGYYTAMLFSKSEKKLMKALLFLRKLENIEKNEIEKIKTLLDHEKRYIVHAAVLAIMASGNVEERAEAIRMLCRDPGVSRLALYEILYRYRKRDHDQWVEEGKHLTLLVMDHKIPLKHRTTLAIALGGMGYYYHSRYLFDLLQHMPDAAQNVPFIAALIEALGLLHYPGALGEIEQKLYVNSDPAPQILRASIGALRRIGGEKGLKMLFRFLSRKYSLRVQIEAAIEIIQIDVLSYDWLTVDMIPEDANPKIVEQIKAEIGTDNFLSG